MVHNLKEETKVCKKCHKEKSLDWYSFRKDTNKYRGVCITCKRGYKYPVNLRSKEKLTLFNDGIKACSTCKKLLTLDNFYTDNSPSNLLKKTSRCKDCCREYDRTHRHIARNTTYKAKYGITSIDVDKKIKSQNNKCPICQSVFSGTFGHKSPNVDHCHKTGKIRDILCGDCNRVLGAVNEKISTLENMIKYIIKHNLSDQ